eukprot:s808_g5.t1
MLSQSARRLVADPMVGVADLMQPLEKLLTREKGMSNLSKFLQPPSGASWKSAVPIEWLCKHQELFMDYINVAKNSVISGKKHKKALEKLDEQYQIIQGRKSREDGIDYLDDALRMGLAHLRQLRQSTEKEQTAYRRGTGSSDDLASATHVKQEIEMADNVTLKIFGEKPESFFDRVLNKKRSPEKKTKKTTEDTTSLEEMTPQKQKEEKAESPGDPFVCSLEILPGDDDLLEKAAKVRPLHQGGKSQQQRLNATKPKKMKRPAASKPEQEKCKKQKTTGHTKDEDKDDESQEVPQEKQAGSRKPVTKAKAKAKKKDKKGTRKMGPPSNQLDPNKPEERKLLRKRADSDAWHNTFKAESAKNKDEEECYRLAREAARKAREDFDLKHPKPIAAKAKATPKSISLQQPRQRQLRRPKQSVRQRESLKRSSRTQTQQRMMKLSSTTWLKESLIHGNMAEERMVESNPKKKSSRKPQKKNLKNLTERNRMWKPSKMMLVEPGNLRQEAFLIQVGDMVHSMANTLCPWKVCVATNITNLSIMGVCNNSGNPSGLGTCHLLLSTVDFLATLSHHDRQLDICIVWSLESHKQMLGDLNHHGGQRRLSQQASPIQKKDPIPFVQGPQQKKNPIPFVQGPWKKKDEKHIVQKDKIDVPLPVTSKNRQIRNHRIPKHQKTDSQDFEEKKIDGSQDSEDSDSEKTLYLDDFKDEQTENEKGLDTKEASDVKTEETGEFFGRKMRVAYGPGYGPGSLDVGSLQMLLGGLMGKKSLDTYVAGYSEHLSEAPGSATSSSQNKPKAMPKSGRKKKGKASKGKAKK